MSTGGKGDEDENDTSNGWGGGGVVGRGGGGWSEGNMVQRFKNKSPIEITLPQKHWQINNRTFHKFMRNQELIPRNRIRWQIFIKKKKKKKQPKDLYRTVSGIMFGSFHNVHIEAQR